MDWSIELLKPAVTTAMWAGVVYLLGRRVTDKFEAGINRTLDRLKKAGPAEFESPGTTQQSTKQVLGDNAPPSATPAPISENPLLAAIEVTVRNSIPAGSQQEREAYLVKNASAFQLAFLFEVVNFSIYGSQLDLLQALNSGPVPLEHARVVYQRAAEAFPDFYRAYTFDAWLNWLVAITRLASRQGELLAITEQGREFLKYLLSRGYRFSRLG